MSRARIRSKIDVQKIEELKVEELKKIANLYYVKELSELDIAFELDVSEKTIYRRIKEIKTKLKP